MLVSSYCLSAFPQHQLILIPCSEQVDITRKLEPMLISSIMPYALGAHEVTNQMFVEFLADDCNSDWRIEKITKRGSGQDPPPSQYYTFSNEYHLFGWDNVDEEGRLTPANDMLDHPVAWVSWFCAAAFCNWLSSKERRRQEYPIVSSGAYDQSKSDPGYRMPTPAEWYFAAQGGKGTIRHPWEQVPYALTDTEFDELVESLNSSPISEVASEASRLSRLRSVIKTAMLMIPSPTSQVLRDPLGPFGTSGMVGNVKEWCHEIPTDNDQDKKVVIGATAKVGEKSFSFDYWTWLYPQNTNPDLGFRIARSLSPLEHKNL